MKIIRKQDEFKKLPDKTIEDYDVINAFIKQGWNFSSKKNYKNFYKTK